jgi:hypothetical protein
VREHPQAQLNASRGLPRTFAYVAERRPLAANVALPRRVLLILLGQAELSLLPIQGSALDQTEREQDDHRQR